MRLTINDDYRISADANNWTVEKYAGTNTSKKTGETRPVWRAVGHYSSLDGAIRALHAYHVRTSDAETLAEALQASSGIARDLMRALAPEYEVVRR